MVSARWLDAAREIGLPPGQLGALVDLGEQIKPMFGRPEPHRQAMLYVVGLLGQVERKTSWQLAGFAGEASPWRMQRLLNRASWDADGVRDVVRDRLGSVLSDPADPADPADPGAVLSLGEAGVVKKGTESVAVARQYSEDTRQVENCQIGVFAAYASALGQGLVDRELFLPGPWVTDARRCRRAGVPDDRATYLPKPELAARMVDRVLAAGLPVSWVSGGTT